jgi:hypothetical protein
MAMSYGAFERTTVPLIPLLAALIATALMGQGWDRL